MDVDDLVSALAQGASLPRERGLVQELRALQAVTGLDAAERARHVRAALLDQAGAILDQPWGDGLPEGVRADLWVLEGRRRTTSACLTGLLLGRHGLSAVERAPLGRVWVPEWLRLLTEQGAGAPLAVLATRWAIPPAWPVPTAQELIALDAVDLARVDPLLARWGSPVPGLPVAAAEFPRTWLQAPTEEVTRAVLMTLLRFDPHQGMRALLGARGGGLLAIAQIVAHEAMQTRAWLARRGRPWEGQWSQAFLGRFAEGIVLPAGWLATVLRLAGLECLGAPATATMAAEGWLTTRCGGEVLTTTTTELHLLPSAAAAVILAGGGEWERVPRVG